MSITLPSAVTICPRTIGYAPLHIIVDLVTTTSTATTRPFHDCLFKVDWGDTTTATYFGGTHTGTYNLVSGRSKNKSRGAIAGHVYEIPGNYTITITVKDPSGTTASTTIGITADDGGALGKSWNGAGTHLVGLTGTDFTSGLAQYPGATTHTFASNNFAAVLALIAAGLRVLLKRGQTWSSAFSAKTLSAAGPGMIGCWGDPAAARPIVTQTGSENVFTLSASDWRICDIDFQTVGTTANFGVIKGGGSSPQNRSLCLRLKATEWCGFYQWDWPGGAYVEHSENFIVECEVYNCGRDLAGGPYPYYFGGHHCAILGSIGDGVQTGQTGLHICRSPHLDRSVLNSVKFVRPALPARLAFKCHNAFELDPNIPTAEFIVVSDSTFLGTGDCVDFGPQDSRYAEPVQDVLFERNTFITDTTGPYTKVFEHGLIIQGKWYTVRNNLFWLRGPLDVAPGIGAEKLGSAPSPDKILIYNNTFWISDDSGSNPGTVHCITLTSDCTGCIVRNNYAYYPGSHAGGPSILVDNGVGTIQTNNTLRTSTPGFVDTALGSDLRLVVGSVAIDSGIAVSTVYEDYDLGVYGSGTSGVIPDKGAFEFGAVPESGGPPPPPPTDTLVPEYLRVIYCA